MNINGTLRKHAYASSSIEFLKAVKMIIFGKNPIFFLCLLKTKIVGTRQSLLNEAVLTSTHNLCFGAKIRKKCIPL